MKDILEQAHMWRPLEFFGINSSLFFINKETVLSTWAILAIIFISGIIIKFILLGKKPNFIAKYILCYAANSLIDLVEQTAGKKIERYYYFISSVFIFILFCNWAVLIPGLEEPTKNLNTTLAMALISFLYVQKEHIRASGLKEYLSEYFLAFRGFFPLNLILGLAMFPLKLLSESSSILSLSFRLFGNIFGGSIIVMLFENAVSNSALIQTFTMGLRLIMTSFFILFEGLLQAFVFSILSLTAITIATQKEDDHA